MWKTFGNLKSGIGDITSKTLSTVAKAGNKAKEMINQADDDDFFERELNLSPVNPLEKPQVIPKNKDAKLTKESSKSGKDNFLNEILSTEEISEPSTKADNAIPKVFSIQKPKGQDLSPISAGQGQANFSTSMSTSSLENSSISNQNNRAVSDKTNTTQSGQDTFGKKVNIETYEDTAKSNITNGSSKTEAAARSVKAESSKPTATGGIQTEKNKENKEMAGKNEKAPNKKELDELRATLEEKEEALEKFAEDNDRLIKERHELRTLAETFQLKVNTLDKSLTETLAKNTKLEEQVNRLTEQLNEVKRHRSASDIHIEVPQDRKEAMNEFIRDSVRQYTDEISSKLLENLNQEILQQIETEEEGVSNEVRDLMNAWAVKPETIREFTKDIVSEEKIIKPFYDENLLKEEIECQKDENNKLRDQAEEYEERIRQLEAQIQQEQESLKTYKEETDQTLKKYTEDFVRVEQNLENLEEEAAEYKAVLKTRSEDIQRLENIVQEKESHILSLENKIQVEIAAKEELKLQYDSIVTGMKEFESTMSELNRDNERLANEHGQLLKELEDEKKRAQDNEHTLSIESKNNLLEKLSALNCFNQDLDIEKSIASKLTYKDGRVPAKALVESLESGLSLVIDMANKRFDDQLGEERNKERDRYNALAKELEKSQNELRDGVKRERELQSAKEELRRKNDELNETIENLNSSSSDQSNKIKDLQKTINELNETKRKYLDEMAAKTQETEQLKIRLNSLEEDTNELSNYVAKLEGETGAIPELSAKLERQAADISALNEMLQSKDEENEHLNMTITNLQSVIDENQQTQESLSNQYTTEIKRLRNDLEQYTRKSQILQEYKEKYEAMEKDHLEREAKIKELSLKLRESEQEKNAINAEAAALIKKAKNEAIYKDNLVDKRVITTFLLKYFDFNATFEVKRGVLETMGSILGFTDNERATVGLPRQRPDAYHKKEEEKAEGEVKKQTETETESSKIPSQTEIQATDQEKKEKEEEEEIPKPTKSLTQMFMSFLREGDK